MSDTTVVEILLVEDNPPGPATDAASVEKRPIWANHIHIARDGEEALQFIFCEANTPRRKIENAPKVIMLTSKLPEGGRKESVGTHQERSAHRR